MVALINARELSRRIQLEGVEATLIHLEDAFAEGHLTPQDFSIRDLAEATIFSGTGEPIGREWVRRLGPQKSGGMVRLEAEDGVDATAFLNISGQLAYNSVMQGYNQEIFIGDQLVETIQTDLSGERIPGITGVSDPSDDTVHPGMPYPHLGFGEDYVDTPATTKRGFIISILKETIFFDRTNEVTSRGRTVGEVLARRKEKRILDTVMGILNTFKWRGTTYNTYQSAAPWINMKGSNAVDPGNGWVQIDAMEQLFVDMLDPNTGEPITIEPRQILHMPARRQQFRQVLNGDMVRTTTGAYSTYRNDMIGSYQLLSSRFAYRRLIAAGESAANSKDYWYAGDFKKGFVYMQNWPITVVQSPQNSEAEFNQDIVFRMKASERGVAAVRDPRAVAICFATSTLFS